MMHQQPHIVGGPPTPLLLPHHHLYQQNQTFMGPAGQMTHPQHISPPQPYHHNQLMNHHNHQLQHHQQQQPQQQQHHHQQPQQHHQPTTQTHQMHHQQQQHHHQSHHHQQILPPPPHMVLHQQPSPGPSYTPTMHSHSTPSPSPHHGHTSIQYERVSPFHQNIAQTEFRIIELNNRLQNRPKFRGPVSPLPILGSSEEILWWENFVGDFFDDDATLTIRIAPDDKPVEYTIGRTLIPRFFKSHFEGGIADMSIKVRNGRETTTPHMIMLECDQTDLTSKYIYRSPITNIPINLVIHTEGHLSLEFVSNSFDTLLIKAWRFYTHQCHEYIDRSLTNTGVPNSILMDPVTKHGLTTATISYLRMCMIMEPMQELMMLNKQSAMGPRSCLKYLLADKYKYKTTEEQAPPVKRRKRKTPANPGGAAGNKKTKSNALSYVNNNIIHSATNTSNNSNGLISPTTLLDKTATPPANATVAPQSVMVVGEPSLLGPDYEDENIRYTIKLENEQYVDQSFTNIQPKLEVETRLDVTEEVQNFAENETVLVKQEIEESKQLELSASPKEDLVNCDRSSSPNVQHQSEETIVAKQEQQEKPQQQQAQVIEETIEKENKSSAANNIIRSELSIETSNIINNNNSFVASQSENQVNILNSIPEEIEETSNKANTCDSMISKQTPPLSSANKNALATLKQNRRRSSERKETLREGLMRTSDFVVAMRDLKCENPVLWRITTGNNLLQQFEPKIQEGVVIYENTNQYAGWNPEIRKDYVGVDVKLTQHTRNQITVERLLLNFQKLEDAESFYDKHFVIYLQIIISIALDPKFWESIEIEPQHHDYFLTSRRIIDDITKQFKFKLTNKLKLSEITQKNIEKYPILIYKNIDSNEKEKDKLCRGCNINLSTKLLTFGNRSYDLHSYKPVKLTSETTSKTEENNFCESCLEIISLYSEVHHLGWKLYNLAKEKIEQSRSKSSPKPINAILDDCLKDEMWLKTIYAERNTLWSKIEQIK